MNIGIISQGSRFNHVYIWSKKKKKKPRIYLRMFLSFKWDPLLRTHEEVATKRNGMLSRPLTMALYMLLQWLSRHIHGFKFNPFIFDLSHKVKMTNYPITHHRKELSITNFLI